MGNIAWDVSPTLQRKLSYPEPVCAHTLFPSPLPACSRIMTVRKVWQIELLGHDPPWGLCNSQCRQGQRGAVCPWTRSLFSANDGCGFWNEAQQVGRWYSLFKTCALECVCLNLASPTLQGPPYPSKPDLRKEIQGFCFLLMLSQLPLWFRGCLESSVAKSSLLLSRVIN